MKQPTEEDKETAQELFDQLRETFEELKSHIYNCLPQHERDRFKYNCLGHCEPGLFEETVWVTRYSSIRSLEAYVADITGSETDEENGDEDEDDEN